MTYKEAKDNLVGYLIEHKDKFDKKTLETFWRAIDALIKRDPLEPIVYGDGCSDGDIVYDTWKCPNCEYAFEIEYDKHDYCPICGQAIDWTDYEEELEELQ